MSLRIKFPIAASLCVILSLSTYLLLDSILTRSFLLQEQTQTLRALGLLACSELEVCSSGCQERAQTLLERFHRHHESIELIIIEQDSTVFAASRPDLVGRHWREEGIQSVLDGALEFHWTTMEHHGEPVLDITLPCQLRGRPLRGAIHVAQSLPRAQEHMKRLRIRHTLFAVGAAVIEGIFLSILTYLLVIRRLGRLARDLHVVEPEAGEESPASASMDEVERLSRGLFTLVGGLNETTKELAAALVEKDQLLARVERFNDELEAEVASVQEELLRTEHLSTVGQLAAGLAHELRNPLFIIRATAESLVRRCEASAEVAQDITEEVDRVDRILSRLLDLGTPLSIELGPLELTDVLSDAISKVERSTGGALRISLEAPPKETMIEGDYHFLRQAFINILTNAYEAIEGAQGGRVTASIEGRGEEVVVTIADTGVGMNQEDLEGLFRPFFTRKAGGTGLGLCTARKILDLHRAAIAVESELGQGTAVTVTFRAAKALPEGAPR